VGGGSVLDEVLDELVLSARVISGREAKPSMTILDSKSVKNAFTAEEKGYDGGKKNSRGKIPRQFSFKGQWHKNQEYA
jgi:hypothetical protein